MTVGKDPLRAGAASEPVPIGEGARAPARAPREPEAPEPPRELEAIAFHRAYVAGGELDYIAEAIRSGSLAGDAAFTRRCAAHLAAQLATRGELVPEVLLTGSCTTALEMAALLVKGDAADPGEVILPSFTFVSTANAFLLHGFTPVFVDVRDHDGNIDPARVTEAITTRTRAIVPVHYAGVPCDMAELDQIARSRGIAVVEDAAQALYSRYRGRHAGTLGVLGCFSFHETKNISCGEGGALVINEPGLAERARHLRDKGTNRARFLRGEIDKYTWIDSGGSYLPSELQAAYLLAQLEGAERVQARRQIVASRYRQGLDELEKAGWLRLPHPAPDVESNHHIFWILLSSEHERDRLMAHLKERRIDARTHYVPLHLAPMGRRFSRGPGSLPVVERLGEGLLRLPLHPHMSALDADRVVDAIISFFRRSTWRIIR